MFNPFTNRVPEPVIQALTKMGGLLADCDAAWLVGGSCGALLQGVPLQANPRDLDVYADTEQASLIHKRLAPYSTDEQQYSATAMYGSTLSHYNIEGVQVELVGSLKVCVEQAEYEVRVRDLLSSYAETGVIGGTEIVFMPLVHELVFNVLRERADRYEPLARAIAAEPERHRSLYEKMMRDNAIGGRYAEKLRVLLHLLE
jgi:hypothetical protein